MKNYSRIILFLIALLLITPSKSQDYIPIAVEGVHWIVAYNHIDSPWSVDDLWEYYAEGDTSLNGETYKKIYFRQLVVTQDPPPFEPDGDYELKGFLREDTVERMVYAIEIDSWDKFCPSNEEFLMFDFSVQPGDSVNFCLIPDFNSWTVDTIYFGTYFGFETRYYDFYGGEGIYEGLGSDYGLFEPMFMPLKKSNPDYIFYTYLYYYCRESPCDLIVSVSENNLDTRKIELYPNPTKEIIHLRISSDGSDGEVRIYNVYGQMMGIFDTGHDGNQYQFDISAFPSGNYFLVYSEKDEVLARKKFVVMK